MATSLNINNGLRSWLISTLKKYRLSKAKLENNSST